MIDRSIITWDELRCGCPRSVVARMLLFFIPDINRASRYKLSFKDIFDIS